MNRKIKCPYRTDMYGNIVSLELDKDIVNTMYDIKELLIQLKNPSPALRDLVEKLEWYFIKAPNPEWIEGNKEKIKCEILFLSDLDIFSDNSIEEKTIKNTLTDKLLSLFNKE